LRVFEIALMRSGHPLADLTVDLPPALALRHEEVHVVFRHTEDFGWHAHVTGNDQLVLLSFPWTDHADQILLNADSAQLPVNVTDEGWDDLDQGWWGRVVLEGSDVYVAETDFDAITDSAEPHQVEKSAPGILFVNGVEVRWNVVSKRLWDEAWRRAVEACQHGNPAPVGDWADEEGRRFIVPDAL
jgi:hypothetical protein